MKTVSDIVEIQSKIMRVTTAEMSQADIKMQIKRIRAFQDRKADIIIESFRKVAPTLNLQTGNSKKYS